MSKRLTVRQKSTVRARPQDQYMITVSFLIKNKDVYDLDRFIDSVKQAEYSGIGSVIQAKFVHSSYRKI